jgi:alpha-L-fucosidase
MKKYILCLIVCLIMLAAVLVTANAAEIGGGDKNLNLGTNKQAIEKWQDARFGLTVCFGPVGLRGTEIGWARSDQIPKEEYDSLYKEFDPVLFNAKEWVDLMKNSGFRYLTPVTKHHDGFVMWATKQCDYNIMNTPFHRDWLKEMAEECRRQGIIFGTYYSILDWYQFDYSPYGHGGPGFILNRKPDFDRHVEYMKRELKELIQDYGSEIIQFDGEWDPTWNHLRGSDMYRYLRSLRDDIVISSRVDKGRYGEGTTENYLWWDHDKYAGDYQEREQYVGGLASYPWESWITLGEQWAWKANDTYKPAERCIRLLVESAGRNGNFNLNVTPMPDGRFEQRQMNILLKIGAWLKMNGDSIYATRGGPFEPGQWGASTHRDNRIFLHILNWNEETLRLHPIDQRVKSARLLHGGEVKWKQTVSGLDVTVPTGQRDPLDTIVELTIVK